MLRKFSGMCAAVILLCLFLNTARADDAKTHFDKGISLFKEKKNDAALEEFAAARKLAPNDAAALYWIGFINLQMRKYADALEPLESAVQISPNSSDAHLNLGNVYDGLKRYEDAVKEFKAVLKLQPGSADAYYNLGSIYVKMKRIPDAIESYKHAALLNPQDAYIQDGLGYSLQFDGNYELSAAAYERAAKLAPKNAVFWLNLGLVNQQWARQTVKDHPTNGASLAKPIWTSAKTALIKAADLEPNNYQIREAYGEILYDMGADLEASAQFERAAAISPKQFDPPYNLGLTYARLGRETSAESALKKAILIRPDSKPALRALGLCQFRQTKFADAVDTFSQLTKNTPSDMFAWLDLSSALLKKGDEVAATNALEAAEKNGKKGAGLAAVRRSLAARYYRRGDTDSIEKAQQEYTLSLQDAPDNPDALNGLGLCAQKQKKLTAAIDYFKKAVAVNPQFSDAINNLGVAYELNGDTKLAIASYRKAIAVNPENALAKRNLARFEKTK